MDLIGDLPKPINSAEALLETRRIPRDIDVDKVPG
jgi:hypothetical protein